MEVLVALGAALAALAIYNKVNVVVVAASAVAMALAWRLTDKRRKFEAAVNQIPGPPSYPLVGCIFELFKFKFELYQMVQTYALRYNHLYRIWRGPIANIVISRPDDIEVVLSSMKYLEKGDAFAIVHSWLGQGLLTSTGKVWHPRRKLITPTFHFKLLDKFMEVFNRNSDALVKRLIEQEQPTNVQRFVSLFTLDVICEAAMGVRVNAQEQEESEYVSAVSHACHVANVRLNKPWLVPEVLFNLSSYSKTYAHALNILHTYTKDVIAKRKAERSLNRGARTPVQEEDDIGSKQRSAFLDHLLDANEKADTRLTDQDIAEEVDTFMFAGHDTTSSGISFALYCIAANPHVQKELHQEVDDIFGDSDRVCTSQDLQSMKYVERVLKECLRYYPPVPYFMRKVPEDIELKDKTVIPVGSTVIINSLMVARNAAYWDEPAKFDPDRFLPENTVNRHPFSYIPFSAGPRNCVGQKFAMMELKLTISKVMRRCKLSLPYPSYKPDVQSRLVLKDPKGVKLVVEPRTRATSVHH